MDKNEKLWFSTKKRPSYHNILWSEDFRDTRCCGEQANKICLLFGEKCMKNKEKGYSHDPYGREKLVKYMAENDFDIFWSVQDPYCLEGVFEKFETFSPSFIDSLMHSTYGSYPQTLAPVNAKILAILPVPHP